MINFHRTRTRTRKNENVELELVKQAELELELKLDIKIDRVRSPTKQLITYRKMDAYDLVMQAPRLQAQSILNRDLFGIIEPFRFVLDGKEFSQNPIQFVQNGGWFDGKPAIMGTDVDEMIFVPLYLPDRLNITQNGYEVQNSLYNFDKNCILDTHDVYHVRSIL